MGTFKREDAVDVAGFLEYAKKLLPPIEFAEVNRKLVRYAARGVEPAFVIQRRTVGDLMAWILSFDDSPDLWIRVSGNCMEMMDFCDRFQLDLIKVDKEYRH